MVMMKMAAFSTTAVLLLFFSFSAAAGSHCDMYAAAKGNFTVPLHHSLQDSEQLRWKHEKSVILDWKSNKRFATGSADNITGNGSLILKNLDSSKEGTYTPEIYKDGKAVGNVKSIYLCIKDPVSKPRVTIKCQTSIVKFTCEVDGLNNDVKFEWLQDNKVMQDQTKTSFTRSLKTVETTTFNCRVSNEVSFMTSQPVKQNCTKIRGDDDIWQQTLFGINIWIFVGSGGGLVLVLIILVIVCCIRNKRKEHKRLKDEEELRLELANTNHHHHHHHHQHHHQQQPAGHTGPRQNRSKQQRNPQRTLQRPRDNDHSYGPNGPNGPNGHPQPSPRRPAQAPKPVDTSVEQPPPLPQPRKKGPRAP